MRPPPERPRILVMFIMMTPALRPTPGGPKLGSSSITLYTFSTAAIPMIWCGENWLSRMNDSEKLVDNTMID